MVVLLSCLHYSLMKRLAKLRFIPQFLWHFCDEVPSCQPNAHYDIFWTGIGKNVTEFEV